MNRSQQALQNLGRAEYMRHYNAGWRHCGTEYASLDNNRREDADSSWAWEDGYLDCAGERDKWHRRDCTLGDHDDC